MQVDLIRVGQSSLGTFGVLRRGQVPFALTMERPWMDNAQWISCIPAGRYRCQRVQSKKFGETFEIMDVIGRTHVLFHKGNKLEDTEGCVMVGEKFDGNYLAPFLAESKLGYDELMIMMAGLSEFLIDIRAA